MPLSEDEQRILRQIEEQLQRDPSFGRDIRNHTANTRRTAIASAFGAVALLALTIVLIGVSPYIAFACFVGGLFAAAAAVRHVAALGESGLGSLGQAVRQRLGRTPPKE